MRKKTIWGTLQSFIEPGPVFGRKIANSEFLKALLRHDPFDAYHFFLNNPKRSQYLASVLQEEYSTLWDAGKILIKPVPYLASSLRQNDYACFHMSDWVRSFVNACIMRNAFSKRIFPVTGPVHSLSYSRYGSAFLYHLWPGLSGKENIIATSKATVQVIEGFFEQIRVGYNISKKDVPEPGVAQIPLGVDLAKFAPPEEKKAQGKELRGRLNLKDKVVFLSFSRVSYLSKMDFLPIFDACKRAESLGLNPNKYHLIIAGREDSHVPYGEVLIKAAKEHAVPFSFIPFPAEADDEKRKDLFAAADVFISPVDNIQETFGLTILEAFAASLPVIASAIDGYKELLVPGKNGFLIPTIGPAETAYTNTVASSHPDNIYHLYLSQQCVVSPQAFSDAIFRLATKDNLRKKMGAEGRALVEKKYTWDAIVLQYLELWQKLDAIKLTPTEIEGIRSAKHPLAPDYAKIFQHYYTLLCSDPSLQDIQVKISAKGKAVLSGDKNVNLYKLLEAMIDKETISSLLRDSQNPKSLKSLLQKYPSPSISADKNILVLWALKHDLLELCQP